MQSAAEGTSAAERIAYRLADIEGFEQRRDWRDRRESTRSGATARACAALGSMCRQTPSSKRGARGGHRGIDVRRLAAGHASPRTRPSIGLTASKVRPLLAARRCPSMMARPSGRRLRGLGFPVSAGASGQFGGSSGQVSIIGRGRKADNWHVGIEKCHGMRGRCRSLPSPVAPRYYAQP